MPPVIVPDTDWEPWNEMPEVPVYAGSSAAPEPEPHDRQVDIPQKRYAHLPLVADEMKKKGDPLHRQQGSESSGVSPKKKAGSRNKGILGFMKK